MKANLERYAAASRTMATAPMELTETDFLVLRELGIEEVGRDRQHAAQVALVEQRRKSAPSTSEQMATAVMAVFKATVKPLIDRVATLEQQNQSLQTRVLDLEATAAAREKVGD